MMPPAMANEPIEMPIALRMNSPKNRKANPTMAAVIVAVWIILWRSCRDISSLSDMITGILSKALMTMNRGINVLTKELIRLLMPKIIPCGYDEHTSVDSFGSANDHDDFDALSISQPFRLTCRLDIYLSIYIIKYIYH